MLLVGVNVAEKAPDRHGLDTAHQPFRLRDYLWLEMRDWIIDEEPSFQGVDRDIAEDLAGELALKEVFERLCPIKTPPAPRDGERAVNRNMVLGSRS